MTKKLDNNIIIKGITDSDVARGCIKEKPAIPPPPPPQGQTVDKPSEE